MAIDPLIYQGLVIESCMYTLPEPEPEPEPESESEPASEPESESESEYPARVVKPAPWFVYVARCADGTLYTGIALDVAARIAAHDAGRGARYTRGRGPLALCAVRRCADKGSALRLELALKRLPRAEKEALVIGRRLAAFARRLTRSARPTRRSPRPT
jgi:putative endonuclease